MKSRPPTDDITHAFGVGDFHPRAVDGGQGTTFRVGDLAIKPCEDIEQAEWLGSVLESVQEQGFRIARPVRAASGNFVINGWCATRWIEGTTIIKNRWREAIEACEAFHRALKQVAWSPVLDRPSNPYVRMDGAIWRNTRGEDMGLGPTAKRLSSRLRPVTLPSQLVHGDPGEGNMLFNQDQPPGIIDMAPYWHPPEYALAMLIADSIAWSGAPVDLLSHIRQRPEMDQMLARAVLFRLHVAFLFRGGEAGAEQRARAYAPVIETVERWSA